ncbi:MAG: MFS transporter [Candidatus Bathyarchaeota archaeon]
MEILNKRLVVAQSKIGNLILIQAFFTAFTIHLLLFSYSPIIQLVIEEMGISHAEAGFVFSICILAIMLLRIPWGFMIDRLGFMNVIKMAMMLIGVFSFLRGFASNYHELLIFQLLLGVGMAAILPCLTKIVNTMFQEKAGVATGVYVSGFPVGELVGLSLTSYLLLTFKGDWRAVFKTFGLWSIFLALTWWLIGKAYSTKQVNLNQSTLKLKEVVKLKQVWLLTGLCICSMGCYDTLLTFLPRMLEIKGLEALEANITSSILPLGFLLSGLSVGALSDKVGLRKPFLWMLSLTTIPSIILIPQLSQIPLWIVILTAGFTLSGILTLVLIIAAEHPETSNFVGGAAGLIYSIGNTGSFLFPVIVGWLIDVTWSPYPPLLVLATIAGTTLTLNIAIMETGKTKHQQNQ